jgi:HAD superfamily hydrolase (TIGR01549 family)
MKNEALKAILFDMGGTLRSITLRDEAARNDRVQHIIDLIGSSLPVDEFSAKLIKQAAAYKKWSDQERIELNEPELWSNWMLPDLPESQIAPLGVKLNQLWIDARGERKLIDGAAEVITTLFRRGYRLGLVSNTTSSTEAARTLHDAHIAGCFETIVLSCQFGRKKPDPGMLLEAAAHMGLKPAECAYVGNDLKKDVASARKAGFQKAILVGTDPARQAPIESLAPDYAVETLEELLAIFHPLEPNPTAGNQQTVNAALSTMWAVRNLPTLNDFSEGARRMGFTKMELNHQINSRMLAELDLSKVSVSSVHEPCPADISTEILREQDWLISATDETKRRKGIEAVRRSIELASRIGAPLVVVHAGNVLPEGVLERELTTLIKTGRRDSDEYRTVKERFIEQRCTLASPRLEAVKKSLLELAAYAREQGVCLGLENRFHYMDIPLPGELEELLKLAPPEQLGFWLDTGHAHALDHLGLVPESEWTQRFAGRIVGVHLHDAIGNRDHNAPGLGEIDFGAVSACLPPAAQRTFEILPRVTAVEIKGGIQYLLTKGCVQSL